MPRARRALPLLLALPLALAGCGGSSAHTMRAWIDDQCQVAGLAQHTFSLHAATASGGTGRLLAVSSEVAHRNESCENLVTLRAPAGARFLYVVDETAGYHWGPFSAGELARHHWAVRLDASAEPSS